MSTPPVDSAIISLIQAHQTLLKKPDLAPEAQEALQELQVQDTLISNEIVDQIAAQQLLMLTTLPDNVVIVEDQDFEINSPEPNASEEPVNAPDPCIITEPIRQPIPDILSPRTALSTLSNPNISMTQVFKVAVSLANTAHRNRKDFAHQTELYKEAITRLKREARCPALASDPPYGYIPNDDIAPYFTLPGKGGHLLMAPFIRRCPGDPTHVIGTLGTPANDKEYLCPIYAAPRHTSPLVPRPPPQPVSSH
jgi:cell division protein FtsL